MRNNTKAIVTWRMCAGQGGYSTRRAVPTGRDYPVHPR